MTSPASPLFLLSGIQVRRGDRQVLGPIDLELPAAGPIVVSGPSGAGKSSLLRLLNRLDAPSAGQILMRGRDIASQDPCQHRRRVAMVFQKPVVLPGTIADNLAEADPGLDVAGCAVLLERVGLDPQLLSRSARELSGGEAQRMCLARSLATGPDVVLFDEPTSSLDRTSAARIEELAIGLETDGITTIWVTHDAHQRQRLARHLVVLERGLVTEAGPA